jgi:hypothetical protein
MTDHSISVLTSAKAMRLKTNSVTGLKEPVKTETKAAAANKNQAEM